MREADAERARARHKGGRMGRRDRERMLGDTLGTRMKAETCRRQVCVGRGQRYKNGHARSCMAECSRQAHRQ